MSVNNPKSHDEIIAESKERYVQRAERIATKINDEKRLDIENFETLMDVHDLFTTLEDFLLNSERLFLNDLSSEQAKRLAKAIDSLPMEVELTDDNKINHRFLSRTTEAKMKLAAFRMNYGSLLR